MGGLTIKCRMIASSIALLLGLTQTVEPTENTLKEIDTQSGVGPMHNLSLPIDSIYKALHDDW